MALLWALPTPRFGYFVGFENCLFWLTNANHNEGFFKFQNWSRGVEARRGQAKISSSSSLSDHMCPSDCAHYWTYNGVYTFST